LVASWRYSRGWSTESEATEPFRRSIASAGGLIVGVGAGGRKPRAGAPEPLLSPMYDYLDQLEALASVAA